MNKWQEKSIKTIMYSSVLITILILLAIVWFVFSNGISKINIDFLTQSNEDISYYTTFKKDNQYEFNYAIVENNHHKEVVITQIENNTYVSNNLDKKVKLEQDTIINSIDKNNFDNLNNDQIIAAIDKIQHPDQDYYVKITYPQNGIRELILTTLLAIVVSLIIAIPLGLFAAIYLHEYKTSKKVNNLIHFAIDSLAGIPSIVFGLFGFIFFCITLKLGISLLSGILTVSIMLLPTIIKTIEEALMSVPNDLREASYGLGASKSQTIFKVVIPAAIPGILLAVILSIGRIIGESAIFIFTAGTTTKNPNLFDAGATLTVNAYEIVREYNDIQTACGIGIVILVIILILNLLTKYISKRYE